MQTILGTKIDQTQKFLKDGTRIPVTRLWVSGNTVIAVKTKDKHNYSSVQLGFGIKKNANKALLGHIKGASLKTAPKFLREVRVEDEDILKIGTVIKASEIFKPGDIVNVTGISKGKGYAGVVKRHHFKGGPRTHGQSDRERAPGSIGQTTTPGRVYKGKRMAGRMGHEKVTIKNLQVVGVSEDMLLVKGLVPGGKNTLITIKKVGESKNFIPLYGVDETQSEIQPEDNLPKPKEESQAKDSSDSSENLSTGDIKDNEDKVESADSSNVSNTSLEEQRQQAQAEEKSGKEDRKEISEESNNGEDEKNVG